MALGTIGEGGLKTAPTGASFEDWHRRYCQLFSIYEPKNFASPHYREKVSSRYGPKFICVNIRFERKLLSLNHKFRVCLFALSLSLSGRWIRGELKMRFFTIIFGGF